MTRPFRGVDGARQREDDEGHSTSDRDITMHTPTASNWALYNAAGKHVATVYADDAEHALTRTLSSLGAVRAEPETPEQVRERASFAEVYGSRNRYRGA